MLGQGIQQAPGKGVGFEEKETSLLVVYTNIGTRFLYYPKPIEIGIQRVHVHLLHTLNQPKQTRVGRDRIFSPNGNSTTVETQTMSTVLHLGTCHSATKL